jgi:hypothetical protein
MSESKRRKAEIDRLKQAEREWLGSLAPAEQKSADVARRAHVQLVERRGLVGGCYLLAFFLNELLHDKYSIETDLVVGWVNDGSWPGVTSHAWIELGGKKIDIALTRTEFPESQLPGDLLILDRVVRAGVAKYRYYREPPPEALTYIQQSLQAGELPKEIVEAKNREHLHVLELSNSREGILTFLRGSPSDRAYDVLARLVG